MEDWKVILLTSGLSLASSVIVAIITGLITSKLTHSNDNKRIIQEKRIALYFHIQNRLEALIYERTLIYDIEYRNSVLSHKPHVILWASPDVQKMFMELYDQVYCAYRDYVQFQNEQLPNEAMLQRYKENHLPSKEKLEYFRDTLYEIMQKEFGTISR